jgi:hypothetical protein
VNLTGAGGKTNTRNQRERDIQGEMPHTNDVPEAEVAIYDQLTDIRAQLSSLKKDRSQFLNSKDVLAVYGSVLALVKQLNKIRESTEHQIANRVDQVLDDVFQLLSLFFITVGLTKSAPATYASLTTVQRLLEHLNESSVFTHHDLKPIKERLTEIQEIVNVHLVEEDEDTLLKNKLAECLEEYKHVESKVEGIDSQLQTLLERLVSIRRRLLSMASRPDFDTAELAPIEEQLHELESHRDTNGKFQSLETDKVLEAGQSVLNGLLDDCNTLISDLHAHNFKLDKSLMPVYERLISLKTTLEDLLVTRRWTLRETDLYTYQKSLQEIDDMRVSGKFPTSDDSNKGQSVLLYLLRRCYAIVYKLLESSEPVSEALQPIHNQLSTVRRCLLEVKRMGGVNSARELYPYQMKLASLDNMREDGKFIVDGQIPEGQGTLNALLAECYDICQEMKIEADERGDEDEDEDDDVNLYEHDDDEAEEDGEEVYDEEDPDDYNNASYAPSIADSEVPN